jgi:phosphotransferase system enzyme I (PtsI)
LSQGIAIGDAFVYRTMGMRGLSHYRIEENDLFYEQRRLQGSIESVRKDLYNLSKSVSQNLGPRTAGIFDAQRAMLEDAQFMLDLETELHNELINAEQVARSVFRKYILRISASSNEVVRAKADDLRDIFHKVINKLTGVDSHVLESLPPNAIVVTSQLLPSDTVQLDRRNVAGIIVQEGNVHSHSALLARALGIPSICVHGQPLEFILHGDELIVDGVAGLAFHQPDAETKQEYERKKKDLFRQTAKEHRTSIEPVSTRNGMPVKFYANVNNELDAVQASHSGCEGIGLFRVENIFLESRLMPTEAQLYERLRRCVKHLDSRYVMTIRLLDIGGDKGLPYMGREGEIDSFMGLRGIRLLFKNPGLLWMQLRVIIRLRQEFKVRLLIPVVTSAQEIMEVRAMIDECYTEMRAEMRNADLRPLAVGPMIETPAAALDIEELLQVSDFVSIGTNDLIQYTMAASRGDPDVSTYYDRGEKVILTFIRHIATMADKAEKECSVCGEMANDMPRLEDLIRAGIRCFSVNPLRIGELRTFVAKIEFP